MKIKTSELIGAPLKWAVAAALGVEVEVMDGLVRLSGSYPDWLCDTQPYITFDPDYDWSQGGPIIDREHIDLTHWEGHIQPWGAIHPSGPEAEGPTPLIAVMRCFVASRLGDEVEVPDEIAHQ